MSELEGNEYAEQQGPGTKNINTKPNAQSLPISLAQLKAGNNSEKTQE